MIRFSEIRWLKWWMRGREFGFHGKATAYIRAGETIRFQANNEMMNWSFKIGPGRIQFWNQDYAVLTGSKGDVYPLYGFVTADGKEPASRPEGHWDGRERVGLPMGEELFLAIYGRRKVKVTYSGAALIK